METKARIQTIVSINELERRWKAVRQAMKERRIDFLILQNASAHFCGYVRWFTDMSVGDGYPATVIFPRDDEMTTIWHGPRPPAEPNPPSWSLRGVKKRISVPILPSLGYSSIFDAEKVVAELARYKNCRIGLVGMGFISAALYQYVTEHLDTARFEDATDLVDMIKAIKSDEEIKLTRDTCKLQDSVFKYVLTRLQLGRTDKELYRDVVNKCLELGSEQMNIMVGSAPSGTAARTYQTHLLSNRVIEDGDQFSILIETDGPGGLWGELGRTVCLGRVSPELKEQFELDREAQKVTLELLKPGNDPVAIWDANNEFMRLIGYPEEMRLYAHGQGYDMVERPSLNPGETMRLQARMNIAVHPTVSSAKALVSLCENYIISETGEAECLHKTAQKIFVL